MLPEALEEARDWMVKAERERQAVAFALAGTQFLPDIAVYHAQQAAEKALKAFLAAHDEIILIRSDDAIQWCRARPHPRL